MKFASIYMSNYIGIYNGMGLYEIHIDMTKCKNRTVIIRGDNGGGKSTIMKAMSMFPDPNDSFIPGLAARKEIILIDNEVAYKLVFIHGLKSNGERDTTKAYITKTFNNQAIELNTNGNVSSYKDILYTELGLDANFIALSQLSNDDRGLADKKPAERKRFVNSIISSLETYNSIYKTLTKRSSNYKSMINVIVAKLNMIGDENTLTASLESVESRINAFQDLKDKSILALAKEQSTISILDPDGTIQSINSDIISKLNIAELELSKLDLMIKALLDSNSIVSIDLRKDHKILIDRKNSLIINNQLLRNSIESLMRQKEIEVDDLNQKIQRLSMIQSGYSYEIIKEKIDKYKIELEEIELEISKTVGVEDIMSISKEEYILALETLKDLEQYISSFKSSTDFHIIEEIVFIYLESGKIPNRLDVQSHISIKRDLEKSLSFISNEIIILNSKVDILNKLAIRPATCVDDSCEFIKDAVELAQMNPLETIKDLEAKSLEIQSKISFEDQIIFERDSYNDAVNRFVSIVREVDKNGAILSKLPNGDMFKDKSIFFDRIISGYSFEYMKTIYEYIGLANLFDTYKQIMKIYEEYKSELSIYEGKAEVIKSINMDIDSINKAISDIVDKIEPINEEIYDNEVQIAKLQELEGVYDALFVQLDKKDSISNDISIYRSKLLENSKKMSEIKVSLSRLETAKEDISKYNFSLAPLVQERDKIKHSVQLMEDYIKERDELQSNYEFIETIKYYSSPTTGIQLVFMELYMGKIIALANELLSLLFSGQFIIQPFVINESEFRIPCLGSGYLNDDISSMSSSQIGMISMILSFALLHHSSTKYNIIKLDEIDGPLDFNNRVFFTDVLNNIMDIMGTEQCIMISHNAELQVDNSDIILLKHDQNNSDYNRGNIIWSY